MPFSNAAHSARKLAELAGSATGGDFKFLADEKNRANIRVKKARESCEHHTVTHACGAPAAHR